MRDRKFTREVLFVVLLVASLYSLLPLGQVFLFGGDEGYQLITAFLASRGFTLYAMIWYDQPPLFVVLLKSAFLVFGPSILAARLIAATFGIFMFVAFYQTTRLGSNLVAAALATFLLLSSPGVLQLSVCVMQEVPTFAMALISVLLLFEWRRRQRRWLLSFSAIAMGLALGIKLTAGLVLPAMFIEILLVSPGTEAPARLRAFVISVLHWTGLTAITFLGLMLLWGQDSVGISYKSHFSVETAFGLERPQDFPFQTAILLGHSECVIATIVGIVLVFKRRQAREFAMPGVWLATASVVHLIHRPWWSYYYLHLAIPMAWFAGFGVGEMVRPFLELVKKRSLSLSERRTRRAMGLCSLAALALVVSERRLEAAVAELRARTRIASDPVLAEIRQYAGHTHWIYVRYTKEAYAFHAQLLMPPEIAVVSLKRFWSGQITAQEIVDTCKRYRPEQVLFSPGDANSEWQDFLKDYSLVYRDIDNLLFVRTSLVPPRPSQSSQK